MGILKDLYDNMMSENLENKKTIRVTISQGEDKPLYTGLYTPESCPCGFGICGECINDSVSS